MSFPIDQVDQPPRHLRGYGKVFLEPDQTKAVAMSIVSFDKYQLVPY